jgi:UDP-N-acetylmuramate dehydrogenase
MSLEKLKLELENIITGDGIKYNEPMKNHTSFKVGGPADILLLPETPNQVGDAVKLCGKYGINFYIIGNGSNLIVRDGGYRGVIIKLSRLNNVSADGEYLKAEAGAALSTAAMEALKYNLKGMEFASGIPGTVGGAVTMNAGAYGPEMKDIINYAILMDISGSQFKLNKDKLDLSYRNSIIQKNNYIVLEAVFKLEKGNYDEIKNLMDDLNRRRAEKQPLNYPSAGSTFKRPIGHYAGKLIEDAGIKGMSNGGASISEKHAGFVINHDNATAKDVLGLISKVQKTINEKYNVALEPEVRIIGEE